MSHILATLKGGSDTWLTPRHILGALGPFDLDPCAAKGQPRIATTEYTVDDDGLSKTWDGFVWMNPPYGRECGTWVRRLAEHGNGLALIFGRTDTRWFNEYVWGEADGVLFLVGRLSFSSIDGATGFPTGAHNAPAPSVLVAYGSTAADRLAKADLNGAYVEGWT